MSVATDPTRGAKRDTTLPSILSTDRDLATLRDRAERQSVLASHIRIPTLAVHIPLHHDFFGLGGLIGNGSLEGGGQASETPVAEDSDRAWRPAHDLGDRRNR